MGAIRLLPLLLLLLGLHTLAVNAASGHTSNWVVIVDTSIFWFNYRHVSNALAIYRAVKAGGVPDSQIILMLAEDAACNARNTEKGQVFDDAHRKEELFGEDVQVDYRGMEVTETNLLRVLSGRHPSGTPKNRRLDSDENANVFVYLTGHGGDEFLKFRDTSVVTSQDIADVVQQMKAKNRFKELLIMADTCQASTLFHHVTTPDVVTIGSSGKGESSYSSTHDHYLGLAVVDRFTQAVLRFFTSRGATQEASSALMGGQLGSLQELFQSLDPRQLLSTPVWKSSLSRSLEQVPVMDFFGAVLNLRRSGEDAAEKAQQTGLAVEESVRDALRRARAWGGNETVA